MNDKIAQKNEDNKQFTMISYEESVIFESKYNILEQT